MSYAHGIYTSEVASSIVPFRKLDSSVVVAIGVSPSYTASKPVAPNTPTICRNFNEFAEKFGYIDSSKFLKYGLTEVAQCFFNVYNVAPVIFINVLDPNKHYTAHNITVSSFNVEEGRDTFTINAALWTETIVLKNSDGATLTIDTDYTIERLDRMNVKIRMINAAAYSGSLSVSYHGVNTSMVTSDDIIGSVDATTGRATGLELLKEIYPRFKMIPGIVLAPSYSHLSDVAAAMASKTANISGMFRAIAICDIPTRGEDAGILDYPAGVGRVGQWKDNHSFNASNLICCYPCVSLNNAVYHLSTHVAAVCCKIDYENDEIPVKSPSNQLISIDGMVNADGTENYFGMDEANSLNKDGVIGVVQLDGFRIWGNRTAAYPAKTDPKDSWIPSRRMFSWTANNIILNVWDMVDVPITRPNIDAILNRVSTWINGLVARGALLGGRIEFLETKNSAIDLMDGILHFNVYITPPSPARAIYFTLEYDSAYLSTLFT